MKSSRSIRLTTLRQWAALFDQQGSSLSREELQLVQERVLKRLESYLLKVNQKYSVPMSDDHSSFLLWRGKAPIELVWRIRVIRGALSRLSEADCLESAIVEAESLAGLSGKQLIACLFSINGRLDRDMPEHRKRLPLLAQIKRLIVVAEQENCPESVIDEILALTELDQRKLPGAIVSILARHEQSIVYIPKMLQKMERERSSPSTEKSTREIRNEQQREKRQWLSLVKKRDDWKNIYGFEALSTDTLADIPSAELLDVWGSGINAFDADDKAVIRMTLRSRVGIDNWQISSLSVCPKCSLLGDACICRDQS